MKGYKGWTAAQRYKSLYKVKKAIKDGVLKSPDTLPCEICGLTEGIREYHCTNYDDDKIMTSLRCLCYNCHRKLHVVELGESNRFYNSAKKYFENVKSGILKPVYSYRSNGGKSDDEKRETGKGFSE